MILAGRLLIDPAVEPAPGWVRTDGDVIAEIGSGCPPGPIDAGGDDALVCPGFVDAHLHLPQFESIGCEAPDLLTWLDTVIFPAESSWADVALARARITAAHARLLRAGTLAYAGYLTSHPHGADALAAAHLDCPLASLAGVALMDRAAPEALITNDVVPPAPSAGRLRSSVNPRFAISCTPELLRRAAAMAGPDGWVQTHLAEQPDECAQVRDLFPHLTHYAEVYDEAGLLSPRAILAHAVHLAPEEWRLIAERDCVVAHCPGANLFLASGLFDLRAARDAGVRVALGSDVAAGPDVAMPRVARAMIEVAKIRRHALDPAAPVPTPVEAWRMITEGNADAIGLPRHGRIAEGMVADLLVLDPPVERDEHLIGRLLYGWRDDFISHRVVAGRLATIE